MISPFLKSRLRGQTLRALLFAGLLALSASPSAAMQGVSEQSPSDDMAQALAATARSDPAEALSRYLRILSRDPHDLAALTGAGRSALDIGDANAAISFYARAEELAPKNGQVKAGLGSAMVQLEQPKAALKLFDEAVALGVSPVDIGTDRGLAYDLRGDNKRAQVEYMTVLQRRNDPETIRRLGLSQAMGGDRVAALQTLDPLLRRQDKAAWRARAFVYAITGDVADANSTARSVLPRAQADALSPFLARMDKLKPGQQASAVHFGHFPSDGRTYQPNQLFADNDADAPALVKPAPPPPRSASSAPIADDEFGDGIGLDAKSVARRPVAPVRPAVPLKASPAATGLGQSLSPGVPPRLAVADEKPSVPSFAIVPPVPKASEKSTSRAKTVSDSSTDDEDCKPVRKSRYSRHVTVSVKCKAEAAKADEVKAAKLAKDDSDDCQPVKTHTTKGRHKAATKSAACKAESASSNKDSASEKTAAKDDCDKPRKTTAKGKHKVSTTCTDELASKKDKVDSKASTKGKGTERYWVQIATGAYKPDLPKEWARLKSKYGSLLGGYSPSTVPMNKTNRLLIGPFKSSEEAQAFVNKAGKSGFGTSPYTSPAGASVGPID